MEPVIKAVRLVSKREYGRIFIIMLTMAVSSACLFPLMAIGMAGVVSRSTAAGIYHSVPGIGISLVAFSATVFLFSKLLVASLTKILALEYVAPVTRANTGDLPATDSLARVSQEPKDEQTNVLLRAVIGVVRASLPPAAIGSRQIR